MRSPLPVSVGAARAGVVGARVARLLVSVEAVTQASPPSRQDTDVTGIAPTAARSADRDLDFDPAMSPAETVMWKIGNDPLLRPIAGTLAVVDRPIDMERFRRRLENAVAEIARLRERVGARIGAVGPPALGGRRRLRPRLPPPACGPGRRRILARAAGDGQPLVRGPLRPQPASLAVRRGRWGRGGSGRLVRQAAPHHQRRHRPAAPLGALPRRRTGSAAGGTRRPGPDRQPKPRRDRRPGRRRHLQSRPSTGLSSGWPAWPNGRWG